MRAADLQVGARIVIQDGCASGPRPGFDYVDVLGAGYKIAKRGRLRDGRH